MPKVNSHDVVGGLARVTARDLRQARRYIRPEPCIGAQALRRKDVTRARVVRRQREVMAFHHGAPPPGPRLAQPRHVPGAPFDCVSCRSPGQGLRPPKRSDSIAPRRLHELSDPLSAHGRSRRGIQPRFLPVLGFQKLPDREFGPPQGHRFFDVTVVPRGKLSRGRRQGPTR